MKRGRDRDEWFYRARFEQSGENSWLLEYGRSPSAWQSPWFRQVIRTNVMVFVRWCNSRKISLGKTAKWLNERGPSPSKRATWHKSTLRYLLDRSPDSAEDVGIKIVMRLLKGLRWAERNQQPWLDRITESSESTLIGSNAMAPQCSEEGHSRFDSSGLHRYQPRPLGTYCATPSPHRIARCLGY